MKLTSKLGTLATLAALGLAAHPAAAQSAITFSTPHAVGNVTPPATGPNPNDTDIITTGTLVTAFGESNTAATVNGVMFAGANSTTGFGNVAIASANGGPYNPGGNTNLSSSYQTVLNSAVYNNNGSTPTLGVTMSGLTVGDTYQFQFFVDEPRNTSGRHETLSDGLGNTSGVLNFDGGSYLLGTFAAVGSTENFTVNAITQTPGIGFGDTAAQLNAFQLRDITPAAAPEPSQFAAFGLGILGLAAMSLKARKRTLA